MTTLNTIIEERHNAREEEFAKLARSVKARIEQQKTPNEEGANKALQILIDTHHHQLQKARQDIHTSLVAAVEGYYLNFNGYEISSVEKEAEAAQMGAERFKDDTLTIINSIFKK